MKYRTTNKEIRNNFGTVLSVGYCGMQNLLHFQEPAAYTCGTYGWNADLYDLGGVAISTGYRPIGKHVDYDALRPFEEAAGAILNNWDIPYDEKRDCINGLLSDFLQAVR